MADIEVIDQLLLIDGAVDQHFPSELATSLELIG